MTIINSTKFLEFKSTSSPQEGDWFYVRRTNDKSDRDSAVVITTLVKIDNIYHFLFLKTKRPPILAENKAEFCLESPAGLVGDIIEDEKILDCARKELFEEGGLKADRLYLELTNSATSAGLSSETLSYVTAFVDDDTIISKPVDDGGIIVDRFYIKTSDLFDFLSKINQNHISISSPTVCGLFYAVKRLDLLTQR